MDGQSKNLTQEYIKQIQAIFPEAVTEVADKDGNNISLKVDMEKLSILLGEASIPEDDTDYKRKYGEKFSFEWAGKRRAIAEAQKRSTGTLRPCLEESEDWENTENLYIEGDNLEVLKLLQDSYLGAIKMIYIDPPYNTGKDFIYKDNYRDNLSNYLEQTNTTNAVNSEASGRYHTNWLNMMYPRLKLARNLLTDDGVILVSIGDAEFANLTQILDEIFGENNRTCIFTWRSRSKPTNAGNSKFRPQKNAEYILVYSKQTKEDTLFNCIPAKVRVYPHQDENGNYRTTTILTSNRGSFKRETMRFESNGYTPDEDYRWKAGKETIDSLFATNHMLFNNEGIPMEKKYAHEEVEPLYPIYCYMDTDLSGTAENGKSDLNDLIGNKHGFDTLKPVQLMKYLIATFANKDSIVLDFFSGTSTTAQAIIEQNFEDGGCRKYIEVQIPFKIEETNEAYYNGFKTICDIAYKRLKQLKLKLNKEQIFTSNIDCGFKVFKLDRSNVADWDLELNTTNEKDAQEKLTFEFNKVLNILKEGRTELDLLYEVMLKLGLQLTTKVEEKEINGKNVFVVGHGVMVASFAKELTYSDITKMLEYKPDYVQPGEFKVVLSDESFASNNDKVNVMQLFKQKGITNFEII